MTADEPGLLYNAPPQPQPVACDYADVVLTHDEREQRFLFQGHLRGGAPGPAGFSLAVEGARALSRHLANLLLEAEGHAE